jgi:hypothetical protein
MSAATDGARATCPSHDDLVHFLQVDEDASTMITRIQSFQLKSGKLHARLKFSFMQTKPAPRTNLSLSSYHGSDNKVSKMRIRCCRRANPGPGGGVPQGRCSAADVQGALQLHPVPANCDSISTAIPVAGCCSWWPGRLASCTQTEERRLHAHTFHARKMHGGIVMCRSGVLH